MFITKSHIALEDLPFPSAIVEGEHIVAANKQYQRYLGSNLPEVPTLTFEDDHFYLLESRLNDKKRLLCLLPISDFVELQNQLQQLQREHHQLQKSVNALLEKIPIAIVIVDKEHFRTLFANDKLLEICEVELERFYSTPCFTDLLKSKEGLIRLLEQIRAQATAAKGIAIEVETLKGNRRWWYIHAQPWHSAKVPGIILSILDLTKEKEQEMALQAAYQELAAQNEMLQQQRDELESLNRQLEQANKLLAEQKATLEEGLRYAQKVQWNLLFPSHFKGDYEHFSIAYWSEAHTHVSGDFLWIRENTHYCFVGVCDATGHGAAGALMATLCYFLLDNAWQHYGQNPQHLGKMLAKIHKEVVQMLGAEKERVNTEGMEILLLALPIKNHDKIFYAGAKRPLVVIQNGSVQELKTENYPIGFVWEKRYDFPFATYQLPVEKSMRLFGFSDGITDQFGTFQGKTKRLGKKRLYSLLQRTQSLPLKQQMNLLKEALQRWQGDLEATDDKILVGVSFH